MSSWRIAAGQVGEKWTGDRRFFIVFFRAELCSWWSSFLSGRPVFFFRRLSHRWWSHAQEKSIQRTRGFRLSDSAVQRSCVV
jgi:hypothetical protein